MNQSGMTQNFIDGCGPNVLPGELIFVEGATAGDDVVFTITTCAPFREVDFFDTSNAGTSTFVAQLDSNIIFNDDSSASSRVLAGAVTLGTNSGVQAFLAPSKGAKKPASLTIQSALTLNDDSTYIYQLNTKRAVADEVIANGVMIDSGAKFSFRPSGNNRLSVGQAFTVISNTAATPIAGTFHNLPDGKVIIVNGSRLQASYTGGDGNDLTLTVIP